MSIPLIPRWNEEAATLEACELLVSPKEERYLRGPRLLSTFDPGTDTFRYVRVDLTDVQLEAADGSRAQMVVATCRFFLLVPNLIRKVFARCWISSDAILCDEIMVKPRGTGPVKSHGNTRKLVKH